MNIFYILHDLDFFWTKLPVSLVKITPRLSHLRQHLFDLLQLPRSQGIAEELRFVLNEEIGVAAPHVFAALHGKGWERMEKRNKNWMVSVS